MAGITFMGDTYVVPFYLFDLRTLYVAKPV